MVAFAFVGVILIGFVFELLFQFLFELIFELLLRLYAESARRLLWDRVTSRLVMFAIGIVGAFGIGLWRGGRSDAYTWGFAVATVIVIVALFAAWRHSPGTEPSGQLARLLTWWPRERTLWFAGANFAFVVGYLITQP